MIIETKFNEEDEVYVMRQNKIKKIKISGLYIKLINKLEIGYILNGDSLSTPESELFATKEELIASL